MKKNVLMVLLIILIAGCNNGGSRSRDEKRIQNSDSKTVPKIESPALNIKPIVNVYMENSGSMDGYVKGATEFKQTVYNYLSDIKNAGITDSLNLFYINSEFIPYANGANSEILADFIEKLNPSTFKQRGGNRGASDIADVIKTVLNETQDNEIALLVTDGIFSPGRGKEASEYLNNQETGIRNNMADYLKMYPNSAVIVYQLFSNFNGIYYNNVDAIVPINEQRPYYVWIFGKKQNLITLLPKVNNRLNSTGSGNMFSMVSGNQKLDYAIKPNSGEFELSRTNPKTIIEDLEEDRSGKVRFGININFSSLLLNDNYLTNPINYEFKNYQITIKKNENNSKYTHTLNFTGDKVKNGELIVKLKTNIPSWVEEANDEDGSKPLKGKTYGIKYQITGIYEAFTFNSPYYTEFKITIK